MVEKFKYQDENNIGNQRVMLVQQYKFITPSLNVNINSEHFSEVTVIKIISLPENDDDFNKWINGVIGNL